MKEIIESVKAYLYDKAASPLFGSFVVSWLAWNYRAILTIFSGEPLQKKFVLIDDLFRGCEMAAFGFSFLLPGWVVDGIFFPVVLTIFYIYVYPHLARPVYEYGLSRQRELREIKQREEGNRLLSVEQSRELTRKLIILEDEFNKEIEAYQKQVYELKKIISELEKELGDSSVEERISGEGDRSVDDAIESIGSKLSSLSRKEFQLSELFGKDEWGSFSDKTKQQIGRRFRKLVEGGNFGGIEIKGKDSGNKLVYVVKEGVGLTDDEEKLLVEFSGLDEGRGLVESDLKETLGWHIDKIRTYINDLIQRNFLYKGGKSDDGRSLYILAYSGRKYLLDNGLLPEE